MITTQNEDQISKNLHSEINIDEIEFSDDISERSTISGSHKGLDLCTTSDEIGVFEKIVVQNSSDVHFGNKTFYQGPVTIKQFLYNNSISDTKLCVDDGHENPDLVTENGSSPILDTTVKSDTNLNGVQNGNGTHLIPNYKDGWFKKLPLIPAKIKIAVLCSIFLILILIILFATYGIVKHVSGRTIFDSSRVDSNEQDTVEPIPLPQDPDAPPSYSRKLRVITRGQWIAQPPVKPANKLKTPVPYVIISHTATDNCTDFGTCVFRVRYIQNFHIESNGWWDIAYNFLVGGDGLAYEGRGWTIEGAHTYGYNVESIGISFIGTFNGILPPLGQIEAAKKIIEMGVEKGYIAKDYKLFAHRQLSSTQSPGHLLYEDIKKWPHWANRPDMYVNNESLTSKLDNPTNQTNSTVKKILNDSLTTTTAKTLSNDSLATVKVLSNVNLMNTPIKNDNLTDDKSILTPF